MTTDREFPRGPDGHITIPVPPRFWYLYLTAVVRGWVWRWPRFPPMPAGYSGVSCGLPDFGDVKDMWSYGWEPWCFRWTREYGPCRWFRVRCSEDSRC